MRQLIGERRLTRVRGYRCISNSGHDGLVLNNESLRRN